MVWLVISGGLAVVWLAGSRSPGHTPAISLRLLASPFVPKGERIWKHKNDVVGGFTKRYYVHDLVWYEEHGTIEDAIQREKNIKEWKRAWKIELIERSNPLWRDLYEDVI